MKHDIHIHHTGDAAEIQTCADGLWKPRCIVLFKNFKSYPLKVKKWIRITARTDFNELRILALELNKGMEPGDAIKKILNKKKQLIKSE